MGLLDFGLKRGGRHLAFAACFVFGAATATVARAHDDRTEYHCTPKKKGSAALFYQDSRSDTVREFCLLTGQALGTASLTGNPNLKPLFEEVHALLSEVGKHPADLGALSGADYDQIKKLNTGLRGALNDAGSSSSGSKLACQSALAGPEKLDSQWSDLVATNKELQALLAKKNECYRYNQQLEAAGASDSASKAPVEPAVCGAIREKAKKLREGEEKLFESVLRHKTRTGGVKPSETFESLRKRFGTVKLFDSPDVAVIEQQRQCHDLMITRANGGTDLPTRAAAFASWPFTGFLEEKKYKVPPGINKDVGEAVKKWVEKSLKASPDPSTWKYDQLVSAVTDLLKPADRDKALRDVEYYFSDPGHAGTCFGAMGQLRTAPAYLTFSVGTKLDRLTGNQVREETFEIHAQAFDYASPTGLHELYSELDHEIRHSHQPGHGVPADVSDPDELDMKSSFFELEGYFSQIHDGDSLFCMSPKDRNDFVCNGCALYVKRIQQRLEDAYKKDRKHGEELEAKLVSFVKNEPYLNGFLLAPSDKPGAAPIGLQFAGQCPYWSP